MSNSLKEILSKNITDVKIAGIDVQIRSITFDVLADLEEEGVQLKDIDKRLKEKPATWATKLAWMLLTDESKAKFDDIKTFRQAISMAEFADLQTIIANVFENSMPKPEKKSKA